jgi:acyl CoA:acetate/3-ketoacid CoA transferase alpha subunit/acyl CoA:acetate/3-ketoacid CoA transferase beta subunit
MDSELRQFLNDKLAFPETIGTGKVMELSEAVRRFVKPGMILQNGAGMAYPMAAYYEIARQFWGKDPSFTLIAITGGAYNFALYIYGKLCRKIISGFNGDGYPFPSPNPILTRAMQEGTVDFEHWSYLTLTLRLMAGAMGVPALPTKSLCGSSMETDNKDSFFRMPDPFGSGESLNFVKALHPDISLVHGWAADSEGNTLIAAPYSGNHYGPLAARQGVIVTVDKIVDADFIRRHSYMTRIPGYVVKAVCPVPMGAHPTGLHALGIPECEGYGEDEAFIMEARQASRNPEQYQTWVDKWVLGCRNHDDFLTRLGQQRIWFLKGRIQDDSWTSELSERAARLSLPEEATPAERIVFASSRKLQDIVTTKKYQLALCGIGVSNLAAWLAYYDLRRAGYAFELVAEIGYYGYSPQPADPFVFNLRNIPSCRMISDIFTSLGIFMSGSQTSSIGVLGAGQIDRFGNINTTKLSPKGPYLVGSGGANDVASGANECLVTMEQNKSRFVAEVPYITSPGQKVTTVVSQLGMFEKDFGNNELTLTGYFPIKPGASEEESVTAIKEACGWDLKVRSTLDILPFPSGEDLKLLRSFDPKRLFLGGEESER